MRRGSRKNFWGFQSTSFSSGLEIIRRNFESPSPQPSPLKGEGVFREAMATSSPLKGEGVFREAMATSSPLKGEGVFREAMGTPSSNQPPFSLGAVHFQSTPFSPWGRRLG